MALYERVYDGRAVAIVYYCLPVGKGTQPLWYLTLEQMIQKDYNAENTVKVYSAMLWAMG
jgi:hypothetical protein